MLATRQPIDILVCHLLALCLGYEVLYVDQPISDFELMLDTAGWPLWQRTGCSLLRLLLIGAVALEGHASQFVCACACVCVISVVVVVHGTNRHA